MSRPSTEPTPAQEGLQKPPAGMHQLLQRAFCKFGGVLVLVYALVHSEISIWQEDRLLTQQISLELKSYLDRHPEAISGDEPPPITSRFFSVHLGEESLPLDLRPQASALPPGIHEINRSPNEGEDYLLAIRETAKQDRRLYLVYDVRRFDDSEWRQSDLPVLLVACGVAFAIGLVWASRYSRKVLEPLTRLAETVAGEPNPMDLADILSRRREPIEVAHLSRAIERSMRTINDFMLRERELTRHASHELRTPLTVIRGAVELLRYEPLSANAKDRLQRIERSAQQMEELIETFLWLARPPHQPSAAAPYPPTFAAALEAHSAPQQTAGMPASHKESSPLHRQAFPASHDEVAEQSGLTRRRPGQTDETIRITPIVHHVVDSHRQLLGGRTVEVNIETDPNLRLAVHQELFKVVLANLVKNAFYSTQEGFIKISGSKRSISVTDSGPRPGETSESNPTSSTRSFALTIAHELCERNGWRLELVEGRPSGTVATIILEPRP